MNQIVEVPEFKSDVPDNVRFDMSDKQFRTWLADTLSVINQRQKWQAEHLVEAYNATMANEKQIKKWKNKIESPITALVAIAVWLTPPIFERWVAKHETEPKVIYVAPASAASNGVNGNPAPRVQPNP